MGYFFLVESPPGGAAGERYLTSVRDHFWRQKSKIQIFMYHDGAVASVTPVKSLQFQRRSSTLWYDGCVGRKHSLRSRRPISDEQRDGKPWVMQNQKFEKSSHFLRLARKLERRRNQQLPMGYRLVHDRTQLVECCKSYEASYLAGFGPEMDILTLTTHLSGNPSSAIVLKLLEMESPRLIYPESFRFFVFLVGRPLDNFSKWQTLPRSPWQFGADNYTGHKAWIRLGMCQAWRDDNKSRTSTLNIVCRCVTIHLPFSFVQSHYILLLRKLDGKYITHLREASY